MKLFMQKMLGFVILILILLMLGFFFIHETSIKNTLLGETVVKRRLLETTSSPKIVFVGGSNLSYGLDSKKISNHFSRPVVNMGVHGGLGLGYMIKEIEPHIHKDDIVILVPEYHQYTKAYYGNVEVLCVICDIIPEYKSKLTLRHWLHLLRYMPNYAAIKLRKLVQKQNYSLKVDLGFNQYGDYIGHYAKRSVVFAPSKSEYTLEQVVFDEIDKLYKAVQKLDARLYILPPCYQASSYDNESAYIGLIENELKRRRLPLLAETMRYKMNDDLCFDTVYHLTKVGVDLRTSYVIEDLDKAFNSPVLKP